MRVGSSVSPGLAIMYACATSLKSRRSMPGLKMFSTSESNRNFEAEEEATVSFNLKHWS